MSSANNAAAAFDRYAEEWRRNARVKHDPAASSRQKAMQQERADPAYADFWLAFTGKPLSQHRLRLVAKDGRQLNA